MLSINHCILVVLSLVLFQLVNVHSQCNPNFSAMTFNGSINQCKTKDLKWGQTILCSCPTICDGCGSCTYNGMPSYDPRITNKPSCSSLGTTEVIVDNSNTESVIENVEASNGCQMDKYCKGTGNQLNSHIYCCVNGESISNPKIFGYANNQVQCVC